MSVPISNRQLKTWATTYIRHLVSLNVRSGLTFKQRRLRRVYSKPTPVTVLYTHRGLKKNYAIIALFIISWPNCNRFSKLFTDSLGRQFAIKLSLYFPSYVRDFAKLTSEILFCFVKLHQLMHGNVFR